MKTRIRKKELKNGNIEYICEREYLKTESILSMLIGFVFCSIIYFGGYLFTTTIFTDNQESVNPISFILFIISLIILSYGLYLFSSRWDTISIFSSENIFSDLDSAKSFIDAEILKHEKLKQEADGKKIKKTTIIKYP